MLGKGLESLIPPKQNDGHNNDDSVVQNPQAQGAVDQPSAVPPTRASASVEKKETLVGNLTEDNGGTASSVQVAPKKVQEKKIPSKSQQQEDYIFHIEVGKIKPNPNQPRRNFDEAGIRELAHSIREFGFLQPLVVSKLERETPTGVDVFYQLIAGERRLLAAEMLGLEVVPAVVRNVDLEREKLEMAVIENIQRENLNPIETARAFQRLQEEFRMTQREVASKLGKSREVVANTVRLLDLPAYIQEALEKGWLTESHGRLLLAMEDPGAQKKLFDDILQNRLTTRELKNRVRAAKPGKTAPGEQVISPETKMLEEKLSSELGTPVKIERGERTSKIVITFYSEEELENIISHIGKESS